MSKKEFIDDLRRHYPGKRDEVYELAFRFHSMDKALEYSELLSTCNNYTAIAQKVVRRMYVLGEIYEQEARSEAFLAILVALACLSANSNAHAAMYHVKNMLCEADVVAEVKALRAKQHKEFLAMQDIKYSSADKICLQFDCMIIIFVKKH